MGMDGGWEPAIVRRGAVGGDGRDGGEEGDELELHFGGRWLGCWKGVVLLNGWIDAVKMRGMVMIQSSKWKRKKGFLYTIRGLVLGLEAYLIRPLPISNLFLPRASSPCSLRFLPELFTEGLSRSIKTHSTQELHLDPERQNSGL